MVAGVFGRVLFTASQDADRRARKVIPGGINSDRRSIEPPILFAGASGATLRDLDGNTYTDYQLGYGSILLGHCDPGVSAAVAETLGRVDLICAGATEAEVELAELIAAVVPCAERVHFCNSGSEAVSHAIRLARGVTGRRKILKFNGCYHGWSDAVRPGAPHEPEDTANIAGALIETTQHTLTVDYNDLEAVSRAVTDHGHDLAAILIEPVLHSIGCILPEEGFLEGLRAAADLSGALLIYDEVVTGFRHAIGGYQAICNVVPDLAVFAKSMANGLPCASVCGKAELMQKFTTADGPILYAGTFNAHPAIMAAGIATLRTLESPGFYDHMWRLGDRLRSGLANLVADAGWPCMVAGLGSVHILYFREPGPLRSHRDLRSVDSVSDVRFRLEMIQRGEFLLPHAGMRSYLSGAHTDDHVDSFLEAASESLRAVF